MADNLSINAAAKEAGMSYGQWMAQQQYAQRNSATDAPAIDSEGSATPEKGVQKVCIICGREFYAPYPWQKCCSSRCSKMNNSKRVLARYYKNKERVDDGNFDVSVGIVESGVSQA